MDDLAGFFSNQPESILIVDMPLNLPQLIKDYPRMSDVTAKKVLGKAHASIFYAPLERWLDENLKTINLECAAYQKPKLSIQSYNLFNHIKSIQKIKKLPHILSYESHPELFFHGLSESYPHSKKTTKGTYQRLNILSHLMLQHGLNFDQNEINSFYNINKRKLNMDDILDACAMAMAGYLLNQPSNDNNLINEEIIFS